uniref:uS7m n=1 Tax=Polytomella magna TaxID=353565 RepID=UPI002240E3FA|nr:Chain Bg, uS7m [Polytomella magna]8APN_Bg Chain Bg, uS7m [Polytomella magna]8APO_Bg Chain Bg, uS7m [Polytomella magna]
KLREDNSGKDIKDVIDIVLQAVDNVKPLMQVDSNKTGTKVMHVPRPLKPRNQTQFAVKWIIEAAIKRCMASKRPMHECLAVEILLAYQKKGAARTKRDELHKLAMDNRANIA